MKREGFEGLATELSAMSTLRPKDDYNKGLNEGLRTAAELAMRYARGEGLLQETMAVAVKRAKARRA